MTDTDQIHARADFLARRLQTSELPAEARTGYALELIAHTIATAADQLTVALYETATAGLNQGGPVPAGTVAPGTDEFDAEVEDLAARLWETDTRKPRSARSFGDEYASIQDGYRDQAAHLLAPELMEENDR